MASNQPQPMMTQAQAAEMLRLRRRADKRGGCLFAVVMTLFFGVFYWAWVALKWTWRGAVTLCRWLWFVAFGWMWRVSLVAGRWSVQATRAAWPHLQTAARTFHARYGARGWAGVGVGVALLAILGTVLGHH